jgi:hypothetical protein
MQFSGQRDHELRLSILSKGVDSKRGSCLPPVSAISSEDETMSLTALNRAVGECVGAGQARNRPTACRRQNASSAF